MYQVYLDVLLLSSEDNGYLEAPSVLKSTSWPPVLIWVENKLMLWSIRKYSGQFLLKVLTIDYA